VKAWWAALLAAAAVTVALAWPAGAGRVALLMVAVLAGAVAIPALAEVRRRFPLLDEFPPEPRARPSSSVAKPNQLVVLERGLGGASTEPLSFTVREQLRQSARRRLLEHHRLDPYAAADQAAVQRVVSTELWSLVAPTPRDAAGRPRMATLVPTSHLPLLLDEIRAL